MKVIKSNYSTFSKSNILYEKYSPIVYDLKGKTDLEINKEVAHIYHGYVYKEKDGSLINNKGLFYKDGTYTSYYYVIMPTGSKDYILRHLPLIWDRHLMSYDISNRLDIITFYNLSECRIVYDKTFITSNNNKAIPLDMKDIIYIDSEETRLKNLKLNRFLEVGDIYFQGNDLFVFDNRSIIQFKKIDIDKNKVFGFSWC